MTGRLAADGLPPLRDVLEETGLAPTKRLGQNFILDLNLTAKIARLAGNLSGKLVIEVGPGPGGLTRALLGAGARKVIVVERDDRCLPALQQIAEHWPGRLVLLHRDALDVCWRAVIATHLLTTNEKPLIVANLPYNVASKLLVGWLEAMPWPPWYGGMTLMFQREVAERIVARPSTKSYGRLSVISQWRCACEIVLTLGPEVFTPPPKVASAIVHFRPRVMLQPACDVEDLGRVTRALFGQRRKMLRAALKPLLRDPQKTLGEIGIDPALRAETLSIAQIAEIAIAMNTLGA